MRIIRDKIRERDAAAGKMRTRANIFYRLHIYLYTIRMHLVLFRSVNGGGLRQGGKPRENSHNVQVVTSRASRVY